MAKHKIAVLGAGSWGTALAMLWSKHGHDVWLWARRKDHAKSLIDARENTRYLPGFNLPSTLNITEHLQQATADADLIVSAVPTRGLRDLCEQLRDVFALGIPFLGTTKGIESSSLKRPSEIVAEYLPQASWGNITHLLGPSFARDVAADLPVAVVIAGANQTVLQAVQAAVSTPTFRVYTTDDVIGAELGGALKNVIALASGALDGLGLGHSTRAALITRGLAEMTRLTSQLGGNPITLSGLSGMGDLILTCTGDLSRNRQVGLELGKGRSLPEVLASMVMVAEGVETAKSAYVLAQREKVDMPILTEVYRVLYEHKSVKQAIESLMGRNLRPERDT